jgi:hypothetical protein
MAVQKNGDSSISVASCEREDRRSLQRRTIVRNVGLSKPRSIKLIEVRSNPVSNANFSWESPIFFRLLRKISPKALSGPERG